MVARGGERGHAPPRRAALDGVDGRGGHRLHRTGHRASAAVALDAAGGARMLRARLDRSVAAGATRRPFGRAARQRAKRGARCGTGSDGRGRRARAAGGPGWASGAGAAAPLRRCHASRGAGRLARWGTGRADGAAWRRADRLLVRSGRGGPRPARGGPVAHLLLALREDEPGFAMVANLGFSGASWRVRRGLPRSVRPALDAARRRARAIAASIGRQTLDELDELARVADRGAVSEEDELRLEGRQALGRTAVLHRVGGQVRLRLVEPRKAGQLVDVREDVAEDQDAVRFAPEGDVAGGMAGNVKDLEAGDLVTLGHAGGRPGGPGR